MRPLPNGDFIALCSAVRAPARSGTRSAGASISGPACRTLAEVHQMLARPLVGAMLVAAAHGCAIWRWACGCARPTAATIAAAAWPAAGTAGWRLARHHQRRFFDARAISAWNASAPMALDARGLGLPPPFRQWPPSCRRSRADRSRRHAAPPARGLGLARWPPPTILERDLVQDQRTHCARPNRTAPEAPNRRRPWWRSSTPLARARNRLRIVERLTPN